MINRITKDQTLNNIEKNIINELPNKKLWGDLDISYEEYENLRDDKCRIGACAFLDVKI